MPKLIAGYPQNHQPLAAVQVVELVHLGVIPGRRTSERRNILDENNFALKRGELIRFSGDTFGG